VARVSLMARIRSVKPEFWDDEAIGVLSRDARLLYIATWNMADDEGLLRWTASYIKANAFMYDDDLGVEGITSLMSELTAAHLIRPYTGGKARQSLAWVVQFGKHQKPNRPQPSKLPPPSIQSGDVLQAYIRRDHGVCHLCGQETTTEPGEPGLWPSLDHLIPRSQGGSDYPSNIRLSHTSCNKARGNRAVDVFAVTPTARRMGHSLNGSVSDAVSDAVNGSTPEAVSPSVTGSPLEGRGVVEVGKWSGGGSPPPAAPLDGVVDMIADELTPNAASIVRVYVDTCREVEQVVDKRAKGRIAKESAELLTDGAPFPLLVEAARRLAVNGFADIGAEARRIRGERARPSTTDQRVAQGLALVEHFREQEGA
jgi:hypothetical protein